MNEFKKRLNKGIELQNKVIDFLNQHNIEYILSGYEHLNGSKNAKSEIKYRKDKTSLFIRHYPDISLIHKGGSCLIEVKNSSGIEKNCYYNYLNLKQEMGLNVILVMQERGKNPVVCKIEDLCLKPHNGYCYVSEMNLPVSDNVWIEPRLMAEPDYIKYLNAYRSKGKNTSGSSFAFIDFKRSKTFPLLILAKFKKNN